MRTRGGVAIRLRRLVFLGMASVFAATSQPALAQVQQEQVMLTMVVGNVEVLTAGSTTWRRAIRAMKLSPGDEIRAGANSEAEMAIADGSVLKVTADTRLQIRGLDSDPTARVRNSFFHLVAGRIRAVVARAAVSLVQARQGGFVISTPTAVAAVRGSDGVVGFNAATRIMTVVSFRGVWATMEASTQRFVFVAQGQISRASPGAPPSTPAPVPANIQAAILRNAPVRTPAPAAPPVVTPVAASTTAAPATAAPGAPPTAPPPPPPPTALDLQVTVPPPPPPTAPPPPANQATVISPTITNIPTAPPPPPPAEVAAVQSALTAPAALVPPPPPPTVQTAMTQVTVPSIAVPPPAAPPPPVVQLPAPPAPAPAEPTPVIVVAPPPPPTTREVSPF